MDSLNLQGTEDQINGLGQNAVDQNNFIANYNSGLVSAYKGRVQTQESINSGQDKNNMEEFGAYQVHLGDASKGLYDAVKADGGASVLLKTGKTLTGLAMAPTKPITGLYEAGKYAVNLPGRLVGKVPINGVNMGKQSISATQEAEGAGLEDNLATDIYSGAGKDGAQVEDTMVDFYSRVKGVSSGLDDSVAGLYTKPPAQSTPADKPVSEPAETVTADKPPVETDTGSVGETGTSTGTKVAGVVDEGSEATNGLLETTRTAKLASNFKSGLSVAGTVAEGTAKVAGTVASGVFLTMDIGQQLSSGKFFYGKDTAQNVGNTMNEIGSAMDIVGVASADPLLVALGVGASAVGGIVSGIDELFEHKKQNKEGKPAGVGPKPTTITATAVDPGTASAGGLAQSSGSTLQQ